MDIAKLKKIAGFYGRFTPSFSAIGYRARSIGWPRLDADLTGQVWVVTGATGGIGRAICDAVLERGATLLAVARNRAKLDALAATAPGRVTPIIADLALVRDTRKAAEAIRAVGRPIDVLVNNVGLLLDDFSLTAEGFETSYATNILNHWVLTEGLLGSHSFAKGAAIINMSSGGMYNAPLTLDYMGMANPKKYSGVYAYAVHKRGQAELTKYWHAKHSAEGLKFYVMHPGWADTDGVKTAMPNFRRILKLVLRNDAQGADTAVWLGIRRPTNAGPEAFWLDRAPRDAHAYPHTRVSKYTPDDLARFLEAHAQSIPA